MKSLSEFSKTPELLEIVLDSEQIVKEYGEPITFYMHDYVDINTYFDFFRSQTEKDGSLDQMLRKLILDANGQPCLKEGNTLPVDLAVAALSKVNENLGKLKPKSWMNETGDPQN
jgi:hypothetical protein